jgi:hypothetical protein
LDIKRKEKHREEKEEGDHKMDDPKRQSETVEAKIVQIVKNGDHLAITYASINPNLRVTKTVFNKNKNFALLSQEYITPPWDHEIGINPKKPFFVKYK